LLIYNYIIHKSISREIYEPYISDLLMGKRASFGWLWEAANTSM
jgi:hypothetical protein